MLLRFQIRAAFNPNTFALISAPNLNRGNHGSPTEAKYSKMSARDEIARETTLQKDYERIWLPPPVKHSPWGG